MADVALGNADHQTAVGFDHASTGLLPQVDGDVKLVLFVGRELSLAGQSTACLFACHHPAGEHLLFLGCQQWMRAHLAEVKVHRIARQRQIVFVLGRDYPAGRQLDLTLCLVYLVLHRNVHLAQASEQILQHFQTLFNLGQGFKNFVVGDESLG